MSDQVEAPTTDNASSKINPVLKSSDMPEEMQTKVYELAQSALDSSKKAVDIAASMKKEMDKTYGPTWHAIVGKSFGSFVSHESGNFHLFLCGQLGISSFQNSLIFYWIGYVVILFVCLLVFFLISLHSISSGGSV
ncbi:DEBR0S6_05864g1_1 [Brettanomyces bruxellensis]|uniref:Dynein light chain n=1 Tax=Dekkera bruxellensis TaxID=5007 RepID=A0A7D9H2R3_DEKBR|nr:DEBR0S6_05864g1_1 [Brettanomyces bruxellensis]